MTKTIENRICAGYEPIPGYVLEEAIGRGGFGEVWRATAPGGLKKAVKFVFGEQDSQRSARERRSLERLRGVQHPFLLTLERFEAIENQLVIVTELADGSLEDLFKQYQASGSCGIPRATLIEHLQDTADALDYLHDEYKLQHLDIKPGNLLIIGGHVKVADFGLLKDLREAECSIVGGLTPVYAPPELFDGRPSQHSDQYSLAVMYQELLTGTRPFQGRTIAQLATQHVHGAPNLEPLPPRDRPIVARALEKNPERRFDSCKQFVESLRNPGTAKPRLNSSGNHAALAEFDHIGAVEDLPQLADGNVTGNNPLSTAQEIALVVALGGTGADCLRSLRRRAAVTHNDGRLELHSVVIDTDMATLDSMRETDMETDASPCELIRTPLKMAREYRSGGTERLRTISRRWIYNVPRSVTTEGMRPLGRLALVDHGPKVTKQLTAAIQRLVQNAGNMTPRVYVVGSLTGGTCSGMYLDVVHVLRNLLDNAGLQHAGILSMLTTAPMQVDLGYPLALYDAHAALIEMNHFLKAGNGYPGDPGAGWPSVPAARTPLHQVYLVAEPKAGSLSPSAVETIIDYVWTDSTGAGSLLNSARNQQVKATSTLTGPTLHSVGVVPLSDTNRMQEKILSPAVARELMVRWLGLPSKAREAALPFSERIVRRIGIAPEVILAAVAEKLNQAGYQQLVSDAVATLPAEDRQDWGGVTTALNAVVESVCSQDDFKIICSDLINRFFGQVSVALTDRAADVTTTIECMKLMHQANLEAADDLRSNSSGRWNSADPNAITVAVSSLIAARLLQSFNEFLDFLGQRFNRFATTLAMGAVQAKKQQGLETNPWEIMPEQVRSQFEATVIRLHESMVSQFVVRTLVDHAVNIDAGAMVNHLHDAAIPLVESVFNDLAQLSADFVSSPDSSSCRATIAKRSASVAVSECMTQTAVPQQIKAMRGGDDALTVEQAVIAAKPSLLEFGGQQRLILVVGDQRERQRFESQVRQAHEGSLTVAVVPGATPKLIFEARRIDLGNILNRMKLLNGDNAQVTARLSSRTDVSW